MTDLLRRAADGAHGDADAEHGGDDAEAGKRISDRGQGGDGGRFAFVRDLHVEVHHLVEVKGINASGDGHAQGVANEVAGVVVLDELWVLAEDGALVGLLDIAFDGEQSVFTGLVEDLVAHLQRLKVKGLGEVRAF